MPLAVDLGIHLVHARIRVPGAKDIPLLVCPNPLDVELPARVPVQPGRLVDADVHRGVPSLEEEPDRVQVYTPAVVPGSALLDRDPLRGCRVPVLQRDVPDEPLSVIGVS